MIGAGWYGRSCRAAVTEGLIDLQRKLWYTELININKAKMWTTCSKYGVVEPRTMSSMGSSSTAFSCHGSTLVEAQEVGRCSMLLGKLTQSWNVGNFFLAGERASDHGPCGQSGGKLHDKKIIGVESSNGPALAVERGRHK
jgi:hypothetical protein